MGHHTILKLLLKICSDLKLINYDGLDTVIITSINGCYKSMDLVLKRQGDLVLAKRAGFIALIRAFQCECTNIAKLLQKRGADLTSAQQDGLEIVMIVFLTENKIVVRILKRCRMAANNTRSEVFYALLVAAQTRYDEMIDLLLKYGSRTIRVTRNNFDVMVFTCREGQCKVVQTLIDNDAVIVSIFTHEFDAFMFTSCLRSF